MKILVFAKLVPDLVEEISIDPGGKALDMTWMRLVINEFDDHSIEQAILLKEKSSAQITVLTPESEGADEVLFTALAKGADQIIKLKGDFINCNNHALARGLLPIIQEIKPDLILTGVQANNDIDGSIGSALAGFLKYPFIGYVSGVDIEGNLVKVKKEYPGGYVAEVSSSLPAVLGIQAAEQPPRYVAVSKVRQIMKTASIEERNCDASNNQGGLPATRLFQPETTSHAQMISGTPEQVADKLVGIFSEIGII